MPIANTPCLIDPTYFEDPKYCENLLRVPSYLMDHLYTLGTWESLVPRVDHLLTLWPVFHGQLGSQLVLAFSKGHKPQMLVMRF